MPVLEPVHDCSPSKLVPFHIAVSGQRKPEGWYHFYEDDYQFERFWKTPDKYIPKLKTMMVGYQQISVFILICQKVSRCGTVGEIV